MRPIGINTWVWTSPLTDDSSAALLRHVAELGFDAVELPLEQPGDLSPDVVGPLLEETGLSPHVVAAMAPGRDLLAHDPETVRDTQDYLRACLDLAGAIGAPGVGGPFSSATGRVWRMSGDERLSAERQWRTALAPLVDEAGDRGLALGFEPLNRYETSLVNTVEQALTALEGLLGPALGLALDTYHLGIEERSTAGAIRAAGEHLVHLQVCGNDRGAPGGDQTDWPALVAALDEVGYQGSLVIESFTPDNASIARAASIWRPLAASPDHLARDGLAFLRSLAAEHDHPTETRKP